MKFLAKWRVRKPAEDAETVYVSERYGVRSLHIGSDTVQSSMRLARPNDLELSYTRSMMAFLLFVPTPARGADDRARRRLAREVRLSPPAAARACRRSKSTRRSSRSRASISTCRRTTPRFEVDRRRTAPSTSQREDVSADVLVVDGYDADAHVEELASPAFYAACRDAPQPGRHDGRQPVGRRQALLHAAASASRTRFRAARCACPRSGPGNVIVFGFERQARAARVEGARRARASALEARLRARVRAVSSKALRKMNRARCESPVSLTRAMHDAARSRRLSLVFEL